MSAVLRAGCLIKSYGDFRAVDGLSFDVEQGTFLTLLGPSGCGKTTTLRIIAGFEEPDEGQVVLGGQDVTDLPPYERDINTVFQDYALFPHMTVFQNVSFGLEAQRLRRAEVKERVMEALALVRLAPFHARNIQGLSGGEQQRVALARAFVRRPSILLLDEPLGALDLKLRREMQIELKALQRALRIAFVYVTHDQEEALGMSDRIIVMNRGRIEQAGAPEEIYRNPVTAFVADFLGDANVLPARVVALDEAGRGRIRVDLAGREVACGRWGLHDLSVGEEVFLSIRSESVVLGPESDTSQNRAEGRLENVAFYGAFQEYAVSLDNGHTLRIRSLAKSVDPPRTGARVKLGWEAEDAVVVMK